MVIEKFERYQKLAQLGTFSREELTQALGLNKETVSSLIKSYLNNGYIKRVKHNFYIVMSLENFGQPILNRYQLACRVTPDATLINHSAFEVYGLSNQVYFEVYAATRQRVEDFDFDGIRYKFFHPRVALATIERDDMKLTSLEQTVIDSINDLDRLISLEELFNCLEGIPHLREEKLLQILARYSSGLLYQKAGFVLERFADELGLSGDFFGECQRHFPKRISYLTANARVFSPRWRLYVPDVTQLVNQGMTEEAYE